MGFREFWPRYLAVHSCVNRVALLFFLGAMLAGVPAAASSVQTFTDAHTPISVTVGTQFGVSLDANPTTGYSWTSSSSGTARIVRVSSTFVHNPAPAQAVGVGGRQVIVFRAASRGTATLTLGYVRPWEHGVRPVRTAVFSVIVR
jgi:predicted secreted protein